MNYKSSGLYTEYSASLSSTPTGQQMDGKRYKRDSNTYNLSYNNWWVWMGDLYKKKIYVYYVMWCLCYKMSTIKKIWLNHIILL